MNEDRRIFNGYRLLIFCRQGLEIQLRGNEQETGLIRHRLQFLQQRIIDKDIEKTIRNLGRIGSAGMQSTDHLIQQIMLCKE